MIFLGIDSHLLANRIRRSRLGLSTSQRSPSVWCWVYALVAVGRRPWLLFSGFEAILRIYYGLHFFDVKRISTFEYLINGIVHAFRWWSCFDLYHQWYGSYAKCLLNRLGDHISTPPEPFWWIYFYPAHRSFCEASWCASLWYWKMDRRYRPKRALVSSLARWPCLDFSWDIPIERILSGSNMCFPL